MMRCLEKPEDECEAWGNLGATASRQIKGELRVRLLGATSGLGAALKLGVYVRDIDGI